VFCPLKKIFLESRAYLLYYYNRVLVMSSHHYLWSHVAAVAFSTSPE
jgi:hypothetical protein